MLSSHPTPYQTIKFARDILENKESLHVDFCNSLLEDKLQPTMKAMNKTDMQINSQQVNWQGCPAVERVKSRVSGQWVVKGTRIPVAAIIQNYNSGYSAEELASEIFEGLPVNLAKEIIKYAAKGI